MLTFTKMHGIGNDYIYVECFTQRVDDPGSLARVMSDRHFGVGGDGVILLLPPGDPSTAELRMRMFNADGSESEMCGNGIRCVCKLAHDRGLSRARPMRIETSAGVLSLNYDLDDAGRVNTVTVDMGAPVLDAASIPVALPGAEAETVVNHPMARAGLLDAADSWAGACGLDPHLTCVSMGNPHVVFFCDDVDAVPLESFGPRVEHAPVFPQRINAHVVQVVDRSRVRMRTWERGTGMTLACGTGACAVCVAGVLTGRTDRVLTAELPGGELNVRWDESSDHVFMTGTATEVFTGTWAHANPHASVSPARSAAARSHATARLS